MTRPAEQLSEAARQIVRAPLDATVENALAAHEALRRLGFLADDIYFDNHGPLVDGPSEVRGRVQVNVRLATQGLEFVITCGFVAEEPAAVVVALREAMRGWNGEWSETERQRVWVESSFFQESSRLVAGLVTKGFRLPKVVSRPRAVA